MEIPVDNNKNVTTSKPLEEVDSNSEVQNKDPFISTITDNDENTDFENSSEFTNNSSDDLTKKWVDQILNKNSNENVTNVSFEQQVSGREVAQPVDVKATSAPQISQADTIDMINQIAEQAKVSISSDSSSMEMILNPEHLGRIYMEVTTNENGNVHAKLVAENPAVKEALENQIQIVKESLTNTASKVNEVEVMVSTHEFERNLEDDARQEQRQAEEMEANKPKRRSLNINNLDDLSGLASEEEVLVAQMMREQGNTMNIEA